MPDYARGKIYKITSGDMTYIGSTCEPTLAKRLANHVSGYKRWKAGNGDRVTSFQLIETGQYEITLLELCPCNSKDELTARERYWIENTVCVNKTTPGRTTQEWNEANKEYIIEWRKDWYQTNRDIILEKNKAYQIANKEHIQERNKDWYQTNRDIILEKKKAYQIANKEAISERRKEQRARKSML